MAGWCDRCGAPAPPSAVLEGLCPVCLLGIALGTPELSDRRSGLAAQTPTGALRILARLGAGPSSAAYLAEWAGDPARMVVLKKMNPMLGMRDVAARVESLRARVSALAHPNIAAVLDLALDAEAHPYAVTEFCPGIPVTRYCERMEGVPGLREDLRSQIASALAHAHACGLVHGGLTATNVLVARSERGPLLKVLDFGHAALLGRSAADPCAGDDLRALDALLRGGT